MRAWEVLFAIGAVGFAMLSIALLGGGPFQILLIPLIYAMGWVQGNSAEKVRHTETIERHTEDLKSFNARLDRLEVPDEQA